MKAIHDLIGDYVVELLNQKLIINNEDAETIPTTIRQGAMQQDPVTPEIVILVNPGDQDDSVKTPQWIDKPASRGSRPGWEMDSQELGGTEFWWRVFTVDISAFLVNRGINRDDSRRIGMSLLALCQNALKDGKNLNIVDYMGERGLFIYIDKAQPIEAGGPGTSFIWRGKVHFSVLTEKP